MVTVLGFEAGLVTPLLFLSDTRYFPAVPLPTVQTSPGDLSTCIQSVNSISASL